MLNLFNRGLRVNQYPLPLESVTDEVFKACCSAIIDTVAEDITFEYTTEGIPSSGKGIYKMYHDACNGGTFKVFSGANEAADLYFSPETNLAYRAVHDLDHASAYANGGGTTSKADELYLNCLMAKRVYQYALAEGYTRREAMLAFFETYWDTCGQVDYYFEHSDFCSDQKALTAELVKNCKGARAVHAENLIMASIEMQRMLRECGVDFKLMGN